MRLGTTAQILGGYIYKLVSGVQISGGATIWTPSAGKTIRLLGFVLEGDAAVLIQLCDNAVGTPIFNVPNLLANNIPAVAGIGNGLKLAAANNVLVAHTSAGGACLLYGTVWGVEE